MHLIVIICKQINYLFLFTLCLYIRTEKKIDQCKIIVTKLYSKHFIFTFLEILNIFNLLVDITLILLEMNKYFYIIIYYILICITNFLNL